MRDFYPYRFLCMAVVSICAWFSPARAQEDAYHAWLRNHLQNEYGLSGGEWVFSDNEMLTLNRGVFWGAIQRTVVTVTGQPFTHAHRYTVGVRGDFPWSYGAVYPPANDIEIDDVLLLAVWTRGLAAERGDGFLISNVEQNHGPWTKSIIQGQILDQEWRLWLLPGEAAVAHPANETQFSILLGAMAQTIEIGGLALLNFGKTRDLADLPKVVPDYPGRAPDASWRTAAAARIEQHRKANITVVAVDANFNPLPRAQVDIAMRRHAFGFGSAVGLRNVLDDTPDNRTYRDKLADLTGDGRTFNWAVFENAMKWDSWENDPWTVGSPAEVVQGFQWLRGLGMKIRGHNLVWPGFGFMPRDIERNQNDPNYVRQRIQARIEEMVQHDVFQGSIAAWDVINEPIHVTDLAATVFGAEEVYAEWFKWAAADTSAKLYLNEYSILSQGGMDLSAQSRYKEIIQLIEANGGRVDGIGMQAHVGATLPAPQVAYDIIEEFAAMGKEISITEYDAAGADELLAADYMRDLLTIAYSHPAVTSFLMWGFWDGSHWLGDAPIFRDDWSTKPSGDVFLDLVFNQWWTQEQGETDASGLYVTRGFLGKYDITVSFGGQSRTGAVELEARGYKFIVRLDQVTHVADEHIPADFALAQNHPNPFNPRTTLSFSLPRASEARLTIYDLQGHEITTLAAGRYGAGRHSFTWRADGYPSGVYLYRLRAGSFSQTRKMVLQK